MNQTTNGNQTKWKSNNQREIKKRNVSETQKRFRNRFKKTIKPPMKNRNEAAPKTFQKKKTLTPVMEKKGGVSSPFLFI